jgi:hypothetical protein
MGNLQVRFLEGWAPAMASGYSTVTRLGKDGPSYDVRRVCQQVSGFPVQSQLEDERQVRPEIHLLLSPVAIKFDLEERRRSRSGRENSTVNYFL